MDARVRPHYEAELLKARTASDPAAQWTALERAHILSQRWAGPHVYVHWLMFVFAVRRGDTFEALAQLPRLILAAPGSWTGRAPRGNPGSARVGIFTPVPLPDDLRAILEPEAAHERTR